MTIKKGTMISACSHAIEADYDRVHAFCAPEGKKLELDDGRVLDADWVLICNLCFARCEHEPWRLGNELSSPRPLSRDRTFPFANARA